MHSHRNGRAPSELPDPDSRAYEAQKLVLLELVVDPPEAGDRIDTLCELLELSREDIVPAVASLSAVGLAHRREDTVFASDAARYFEHLWPTGL
jgi:predicted transcriptional regulator